MLPFATKFQTSLTRSTSIRLVKQEDCCGAIALTYFVENCLGINNIYKVLTVVTLPTFPRYQPSCFRKQINLPVTKCL